MENSYDEQIQKLLDEGDFTGEWKDSNELHDYEALYRLLKTGIPVELPENFSSSLTSKIVAKRERPLKLMLAALIGSFLVFAVYLCSAVYSTRDIVNIAQSLFEYKWIFLVALVVTGYLILADYIKIKQVILPGGRVAN